MRIFISHEKSNERQVKRLLNVLRDASHEPFYDADITPNQFSHDAFRQTLSKCDVFLFFLSAASANSQKCLSQLSEAENSDKPIIVAVFEQAQLPRATNNTQFIDFTGGITSKATAQIVSLLHQIGDNKTSISDAQAGDLPSALEQMIFLLFGLSIPTVISIITRVYYPTIDDLYISLTGLIQVFCLLIFMTFLFRKKSIAKLRRAIYMVVAYLFSIVLMWFGFYLFSVLGEQPTWYFLVDATEQTRGVFSQQVEPFTNLRLPELTRDLDYVGLSVFGGELSDNIGCGDTTELVEPSEKAVSLADIRQYLEDIASTDRAGLEPPGGVGSIQTAVLAAISRLANRRGVQGIVIITPGLANGCDTIETLDRDAVNSFAWEHNVDLEIRVVIPQCDGLSDDVKQALDTFAQGQSRCPAPEEYDDTILEILNTSPDQFRQIYYQQYYGN